MEYLPWREYLRKVAFPSALWILKQNEYYVSIAGTNKEKCGGYGKDKEFRDTFNLRHTLQEAHVIVARVSSFSLDIGD